MSIAAVLAGIKNHPRNGRVVAGRKSGGPLPWRPLIRWLIVNFGWMGLGGMYDATWSIYMERLGASRVLIGLSWTLFALPYLLFNFPAGRLADHKAWRPKLIYAGAVLNALIVLLYTVSGQVWLSMGLSVVEAVAMSLITPALSAEVMAMGVGGLAGRVQGVFQASGTLGAFVVALISGYLLPYGPRYALGAGAVILIASVIVSKLWVPARQA
jgi:DHA1 family multidrug resistance protein-like MFS transporter